MSLLNLVHKSVVIKFAETAGNQFNPSGFYVFRLTGVDAMGFLQIQELALLGDGGHEPTAEPFWINKDLVREIHDFESKPVKENLLFTGIAKKPVAEVTSNAGQSEEATKSAKAKKPKAPSKLRSELN